jgi:ribose 5-phosphate isomerase B
MKTYINRLVFGSDHGGFHLKKLLMENCSQEGLTVIDAGCYDESSVDYPDVVENAVGKFRDSGSDALILICGSGVGVSIAANRHKDVRAVLTDNPVSAVLSRQHNHANCLCMGERLTGPDMAWEVLKSFLCTPVDDSERHCRRVGKLGEM